MAFIAVLGLVVWVPWLVIPSLALGSVYTGRVLRVVTGRLRNALRADDLLGRWGGAAFVAFLPSTTLAQTMIVAERVRSSLAATTFTLPASQGVMVTASSGCAVTVYEIRDQVIQRADEAMHAAKQLGDSVMMAAAADADADVSTGRPAMALL